MSLSLKRVGKGKTCAALKWANRELFEDVEAGDTAIDLAASMDREAVVDDAVCGHGAVFAEGKKHFAHFGGN